MRPLLLAFISGLVMETIYAANVSWIADKKRVYAGLSAILWGAAFLVGIDASLTSEVAAAAWCLGLGFGTVCGMKLAAVK